MSIFSLFYSKTPEIKDVKNKVPLNSIASLERITIGGIDQQILIRSHNIENPILLFLHGGPGVPEMPLAYICQRNLERDFLIVNWDQRGAGKSYSKDIPEESFTIEQFISDAHELIIHLLEKFDKKKLFLLGHSWGSVLGILIAQRYPELIHAYVGMGQVVDASRGEDISYKYALDAAKKAGNRKVADKLLNIKPPYQNNVKDLLFQRKWLTKYGGAIYGEKSQWWIYKKFFSSPEYSFIDIIKLIKGALHSVKAMWEEICEINFLEQIPELKVPVYFFEGKNDFQVPCELAEEYYLKIKAPKKELVWFNNSGHSPNIEEPSKFETEMISEVLSEAY